MKKIVNMFVLLIFITNSLYGGTKTQQQEADDFREHYSHLFKYWFQNEYKFSDLSDNQKLFTDYLAIEDLNQAFSELQHSTILPLVVSTDSKDFFNDIDKNVKEDYPDTLYKELETAMNNKAEKWSGGLSKADMADLWLTALLTGPKVAMDITSGGMGSTGKALRKNKTIKKVIKIGKKWTNIKSLSVTNFKKIATALTRTSRHMEKMRKLSKLSKNAAIFFDSKAFKIIEYLLKQVIEKEKTEVSISDKEEQEIIAQYIKSNQENTDDPIVQFFIQFSGNSFKLSAELLGKAVAAKYIDLFTTGVLTIYSDTESTNLFFSLLTDLGLKGAEFIPIVGPFVELANKMIELQKKFSDGYHEAEANYMNFSAQRNNLYEFYLNTYKAMVIEDTLKSVYSNNDTTYNTTNIDESFGVRVTINNIYSSIYEYNQEKTVSKEIFENYISCLSGYLKNEDNSFEKDLANGNGISYCLSDKKIFTTDLTINTKVKEKHVQLYINLKNKTLYKIPNITGFNDVYYGEFYYPYVNFLAYKNVVSSKNSDFRPKDNITQYEAIKMTENMFFKKEFDGYEAQSQNKDTTIHKIRFDFLENKITKVENLSLEKKDNNITRGEVAELIMQLISKKLENKIIIKVSFPNGVHNAYISGRYKAVIDNQNGWTVFSTGLKALGISDGYDDGTYRLDKLITRGELSKILIKSYKFVQKEGGN